MNDFYIGHEYCNARNVLYMFSYFKFIDVASRYIPGELRLEYSDSSYPDLAHFTTYCLDLM